MDKIHEELKEAIDKKDYEKICQFLHTNHFESDSEWTRTRCNDSFIQGWKESVGIYNKCGIGHLNKWMKDVSNKRIEKLESIISGLSGYISAGKEFEDKHPQDVEDWIYRTF